MIERSDGARFVGVSPDFLGGAIRTFVVDFSPRFSMSEIFWARTHLDLPCLRPSALLAVRSVLDSLDSTPSNDDATI